MLKRSSRPTRWARALCWAGATALLASPATAQEPTFEDFIEGGQRDDNAATDNNTNDAPVLDNDNAPPTELDLQTLIDNAGQAGNAARFSGNVWDLRPEPGRAIILVPIRITPGEAPYEVSRPEVGLRAARFIAWYLPEQDANNNGRGGGHNNTGGDTFRVGDSTDLEDLLLGERSGDDRGRDELAGQLDAADQATDPRRRSDVPADAPRLARKFIVYPDGTVEWGMDRGFAGASPRPASDQNRYGYKIDPEAVQREEPPRPERLVRGADESSRDFAERRRNQAQDHRDALDAYRALREMVRELPDEFREPSTGVVYAIFEANEADGWSFTGPGNTRWDLALEDLDAVAELARAQGGGNNGQLDERTADAALAVNRMAGRGGPLDQRIAALAIYQGRLPARVQPNDAGYLLLRTLLASDDPHARSATLTAIARVQPPTRASAQLLAEAARNASDLDANTLQLAALRSALRIEAGQGGNAGALLAQANEALTQRSGPPAHRVLEEVLGAVQPDYANTNAGPGRGGNHQAADDATVDLLITRIDFSLIRPDQRDDAIATVIRHAPHNPVAAGWLDQQLLRAADATLADRTLTLLSRADHSSILVQPFAAEVRGLVFGQPDDTADTAAVNPTIDGVIALSTEQHGIVLALTSNDEQRRALAWQALRHFEVVTGNSAQDAGGREVFDRIVDIGTDAAGTPASLVDFIDNPAQGELAQHARVRMLGLLLSDNLDPTVARRAARKVTGTGRDYSQALAQLGPDERTDAVSRIYDLLTGEAPAVLALLKDPGQTHLTAWLAGQWQAGVLPTERDWAAAAGDTTTLLQTAGSRDADVANAAAAALVLNAGGTPEQQEELARKIAALGDRSPDAVAAAWEPIKRDIFAARLSDAAGNYRLTLTLYPEAQPGSANPGNPGGRGNPGNPGGPGRLGPGGLDPAAAPPGRDPRGPRSPGRLADPATNRGGGRGNFDAAPPGPGPAPGPQTNPAAGAPGSSAAGQPTPSGQPLATLDLGIVQLTVQGDQVALSLETVPLKLADDILALQLEDVSTLKNFNHPDLADLPLSQLDQALNLLPVNDHTWTGTLELPDGKVLAVTLRRE